MATTIKISQETKLPKDQVRAAVDEVFGELKTKFTLTGKWKDDRSFIISGESIIGSLEVREDSVDILLTLGGMLGAFASMIEGQIKEALQDRLAS